VATGQITACAFAWVAAIVAMVALVLTVRSTRHDGTIRYRLQYPVPGGQITTGALTEAEFEALTAKLEAEYGKYQGGRAMPLRVLNEEEPSACPAYQPPTVAADSGLCARCGMYDYKHQERPDA
jgi:hypothetical protein